MRSGMKLGDICWICKKRPATTEVNGRPACEECAKRTKKDNRIKVLLPQSQIDFLNWLVESGKFTTISEAIRHGIRLLEDKYGQSGGGE